MRKLCVVKSHHLDPEIRREMMTIPGLAISLSRGKIEEGKSERDL